MDHEIEKMLRHRLAIERSMLFGKVPDIEIPKRKHRKINRAKMAIIKLWAILNEPIRIHLGECSCCEYGCDDQ